MTGSSVGHISWSYQLVISVGHISWWYQLVISVGHPESGKATWDKEIVPFHM